MRSFALASLVVLAAACDQPASPSEVRARIERNVPPLVDESVAAADGSDATFAALGRGLATLDRLLPGLVPVVGASDDGDDAAPSIVGADVARELNETVFTDANHEGDGVFVIGASVLCPADELGAVDPVCVADATAAGLRIQATLAGGDGLDLTLLVGADRAAPVVVALRPTTVTVTVDLGELADAALALAPVFDEPDLQLALAGVVSARLELLGPAHVAIAITIDEALHVELAEAAGADPLRLDTAPAHPLIRFELDGAAHAGSAQVGLGATTVHLPADAEAGTAALDVDLPGGSAIATLVAGEPLRITGISLGDRTTTVDVGGARAMAIDLNPDAGRRLDLTIAGDELDTTFSVAPSLDVRIAIDHAVLGDEVPRYDITRLGFAGAPSPTLHATETQLSVEAGTLTIETSPAEFGAVVPAGSCLGEEWRTDSLGEFSVMAATPCE